MQRETLCLAPDSTSMNERMNTTEIFDGIRFPGFLHTLESLKAACSFQFQDTDVLLVTFPKSGTTWMQQVLSLIFCEGHLWPIHHLPNWARMPWMEQASFSSLLSKLNTSWPRLLTSHLNAKGLSPALMKSKAKEPRSTIRKLSEFLGRTLGPKEEEIILEHSSFSFMSQSNMVNYSLLSKEIIDQSQGKFLRKGVVGNWREYFTPELNEKFNAVYQSKMGDSGLSLPWTMD
ncbi:sulfotransferase family 5A, member 1 isoform X3 [Rattus norvegicus]|uniref:sulfotransferase family 5A, member 1 isoform X3 n=1 Tax=Rattus norvegicus TaxID=10116 RepID=UPI002FD83418